MGFAEEKQLILSRSIFRSMKKAWGIEEKMSERRG